ncbi:MAG: (deoxy)nucleoside triphosphate pyrophosphohydrolase [Sphingobium sp.]
MPTQSDNAMRVPLLMVAAAALVDADGRVLLQQRPDGGSLAGLWEFPGGKMEPHETPETALIRELGEELGITTHQSCLAPVAFASEPLEGKHLVMLLYICRKWQGIPTLHHAAAMKWVRPADMFALPMPPADIPLIGLLDALI